ncbi:MAG: transporter [Herminiimonas sp.]|jgi:drug/metabolite transporter (DMT)-like permease|nr:transporter [Herminiimonas sp.]
MIEYMNPSNSTIAVIMIVLSALLFSIMDAITKYVGGFLSVVLVLWARYSIQAALMAMWIGRSRGLAGFATAHPRFQVLRGVLLLIISVLAFLGLRALPLAEFTAIIMLSPILVTAAAGWMLKESVGRMRWALVWGGFIGTLIVIRPGSGLFGAAVALPLLAMLVSSAYSLLTSRLAVLENPYTTQFYTGITGSLLLLPMMLLQADSLPGILHDLAWTHLSLLIVIGILGSIGHLMLVMAFSRAGTASLMPFTYTQIGFAAIMSWLAFRHAPDFWAWIGMATIAACGAATAWLNMQSAQRAK